MNTNVSNTFYVFRKEAEPDIVKYFSGDINSNFKPSIYGVGCFNAYWGTVLTPEHVDNFIFGFLMLPFWYKKWIDILNSKFKDFKIEIVSETKKFFTIDYNGTLVFSDENRKMFEGFSALFRIRFSDEYFKNHSDYDLRRITSYAVHHMIIMVSAGESWITQKHLEEEPKDILEEVIRLNNNSVDGVRKLAEVNLTKEFFDNICYDTVSFVTLLDQNKIVKQTSFMCGLLIGTIPEENRKRLVEYIKIIKQPYRSIRRDAEFLGCYLRPFIKHDVVGFLFRGYSSRTTIEGIDINNVSFTSYGLMRDKRLFEVLKKPGLVINDVTETFLFYTCIVSTGKTTKKVLQRPIVMGSTNEIIESEFKKIKECDLLDKTTIKSGLDTLLFIKTQVMNSLFRDMSYRSNFFFTNGSKERVEITKFLLLLEESINEIYTKKKLAEAKKLSKSTKSKGE